MLSWPSCAEDKHADRQAGGDEQQRAPWQGLGGQARPGGGQGLERGHRDGVLADVADPEAVGRGDGVPTPTLPAGAVWGSGRGNGGPSSW